jgi:MFS family permease
MTIDNTAVLPETEPPAVQPAPPEVPRQPAARTDSLWRHRDFNRLWFAQAVSAFGSQVTTLALPLTAVVYLQASATQVGLMSSARELALLALMLFFGVLVDRVRRRPLMIGADIGRAAVLATVPLLAWLGYLGMPVLYVVAFVLGSLTVVFDLAYRAYLPSLLPPDRLLAGNSRLQTTDSVSEVAGPGLGGVLVQLLRAPFALLADAVSFLVSAVSLAGIRTVEQPPRVEAERGAGGVLRDIRSGLHFAFGHPVLRPLAGAAATFNFFSQIMLTMFVVYAAREMHMSGVEIGLAFAGFGIGGVLAASSLGRTVAWLGHGRLLLAGYAVSILAIAAIPFVRGPEALVTAAFVAVFAVAGVGIISLNIVEMTLRQVITPNAALGRVNASFRFLIGALLPVAAALSGVLADQIGLRNTLLVTAAGIPLSLLWLLLSPIRKVRTLSEVGHVD